ncbi:DNA/RNA nuclease SfsA [Sneathiella chungangensis]|uniref:Sugar fermentation stimulation protein homolog n=1 Tax=Sneathiella chungangensis TaxID=1418234 RepID=A0A845M953_9PROT|nr:DNA/RNA nuclease SfsA [Sneathiella chungangensis]MZR20875.1 DNA/RNA nuclease SfsA [Sneathiella chungangensis]
MKFPAPLLKGRLIRRYKRFLADIELEDGNVITAHVANPGSMMGLKDEGMTVWLSESDNPKRKLPYSWELVEADGALVGINTAHPNGIVAAAIERGDVPALSGYDHLTREVKYGENSRIDILLSGGDKPDCYVEIKNVTLKRDSRHAEFPDSVTARGAKHLKELSAMVAAGHRAVMFYLVQRADCGAFRLAADIDPAYAAAFAEARAAGVEILCYDCHITPAGICLGSPVPVIP